MQSSDIKFAVENDINPFIIFSKDAKILFLNKSASLLSSIHMSKELYALAIEYAPLSFGSSTTYMDLYYGDKKFYAIMVSYQNEENICLLLYKKHIQLAFSDTSNIKNDINILLASSIEYFQLSSQAKISLLTDCDIPLAKLNQNIFLILMRKILDSHSKSDLLDMSLKIKLGETKEINNIKYLIAKLEIKSENRDNARDKEMQNIAGNSNISIFFSATNSVLEVLVERG